MNSVGLDRENTIAASSLAFAQMLPKNVRIEARIDVAPLDHRRHN
jgi:hypothetical protein